MPRFAANLNFLYTELAFLDRFEAAAKAGFKAVESTDLYAASAPEIAGRLNANNLWQGCRDARQTLPPPSRPRSAMRRQREGAASTSCRASCTTARGAMFTLPT